MRPDNLKTRIFLDGADPEETRQVMASLGFLDGQTTNPSLLAKNPEAEAHKVAGNKFSSTAIYDFYKTLCQELSALLPKGSISIEVYADAGTTVEEMLTQARTFDTWIPNAHIKLPTTAAGLAAAAVLTGEGRRVNMTLVFSQAQAAAVYAATRGAGPGDVFLSPFIGRLDDRGENGMDLIKNILAMYAPSDGHVQVLTASVRSMEHFMCALALGSDLITAPAKVLLAWAEAGKPLPGKNYVYNAKGLTPIPDEALTLAKSWQDYPIGHPLTDAGLTKFAADWNSLIDMTS
ncbi:transaldolase family protein [Desulfovibrio sp. TomC]|uniref:transaldolase family protein n=1 Tax=Desulfovibrio sp. TomC TaxID=1562888 RepID=UPI0005744E33|nr:transaldolase family protein [Desulfovibrio sp. TomC]KHK01897.1 Transaldolase [Desulfovibrio sp. TomC]